MSQIRGEKASEHFPVARNDFIQEKLSARQAKRDAKAAERQEKSDALKEEVALFYLSLIEVN